MSDISRSATDFAESRSVDDLPSPDAIRDVIRAAQGDELVIDQLGLVDSFHFRVPLSTELSPLLVAMLAEGDPGRGWLLAGGRWLGDRADIEAEIARVEGEDIIDVLDEDLVLQVDSERLRFVLDELVERHPDLPDDLLEYREVWPSVDFQCQISLRMWRGSFVGRHRIRLGVGLWRAPLASGPAQLRNERSVEAAGESLAASLEHLVEFQRLHTELILLALFFDQVEEDTRNVFGVPWLPLRSVVVIPRVLDVPTPHDYLEGALSRLTMGAARVLFEKADMRAESVSASQLQGAALCFHRQFSSLSSERVYSSYLYVPVTDDLEQFEEDTLALIGSFETIEGEVAEELWDVSSDLEMVEQQFQVQHRLTTEASEIIDALVAHLLDGDLSCPAPLWRFAQRRSYRASRNGLRDVVELTRRTLVQTEGERAESLAMVRDAKSKTDDVRAFVRTQADQILTRVAVPGFPTVTDSLLSSEKFAQAEAHIASRSADRSDDERLARLLETTTNVFVEERERTLEVVERQASVLNLALGVVALFTIIEFLVDVRPEIAALNDDLVRSIRIMAGVAGLGVLTLLATLWIRTRIERRKGVRPALPVLHAEAVATMRLLRVHTSSEREDFEIDKDLLISERIAELHDDLAAVDHTRAALRRVYVERLFGASVTDQEVLDAAASAVSSAFADFLSGRVDGPAWAAAADLDLLRVETSAWSLRTILLGERPARMYLSWLPLTTALYHVHPGGQAVSDFELLNQVGGSTFEQVRAYGLRSDRTSAHLDRFELQALIYGSGDPMLGQAEEPAQDSAPQ